MWNAQFGGERLTPSICESQAGIPRRCFEYESLARRFVTKVQQLQYLKLDVSPIKLPQLE